MRLKGGGRWCGSARATIMTRLNRISITVSKERERPAHKVGLAAQPLRAKQHVGDRESAEIVVVKPDPIRRHAAVSYASISEEGVKRFGVQPSERLTVPKVFVAVEHLRHSVSNHQRIRVRVLFQSGVCPWVGEGGFVQREGHDVYGYVQWRSVLLQARADNLERIVARVVVLTHVTQSSRGTHGTRRGKGRARADAIRGHIDANFELLVAPHSPVEGAPSDVRGKVFSHGLVLSTFYLGSECGRRPHSAVLKSLSI